VVEVGISSLGGEPVKNIICMLYLIALLPIWVATSNAQVKKVATAKSPKEQTTFGSESAFKYKVALPADVLQQLGEYDGGRLKQCQSGDWAEANIKNHFAATKVNLNGDKQLDLVVQAQTTCFMGAHNTTFWLFTDVGQRLSPEYELAFDISADYLAVLKTSTNGYRDIETGSHTAIEMYTTNWKFDGQKYQQRECKIENFVTKKISRIRCDN
jgi:hypothetical protein